jgi:hypothetical protein
MKLSHLLLLPFLAVAPLAACASNGGADDAPPTEEGAAAPPASGGRGPLAFLRDNDTPNVGPCPLVGVLYDASRKVEFTGGAERLSNVAWTGEFRGAKGLCRYIGADPIEMTLEIDMAFGRGPAATGDTKTYRYWVAVTRTNLAPIEKQYFDVTVEFPRGEDRMAGTETIDKIVIPRANETVAGENFEILVGFDLAPEELAFNRAGKRFRVDAGS